ncbi:hypothetical protein B0H14DRAFT_2783683 [Mycena olivaceomarginata]|nr:hypothetical protein B0H14DRAFT_2783683 [Mycena olivaceomarginata]
MLTYLASSSSSTALSVHWMDSPLLFVSTSRLRLPTTPFPDAGRQAFDSPSFASYHPVLPLVGEGVYYRSPQIALQTQAAANKNDPQWSAGIGLGLGLVDVESAADSLQYTYVLSHPPTFLHAAHDDETPAASTAPATSLWDALTEFLDTTYSLFSVSDSPIFEASKEVSVHALGAVVDTIHSSPHSPAQFLAAEPTDFAVPATASSTPSPVLFSTPRLPMPLLLSPVCPRATEIAPSLSLDDTNKPKSTLRVSFSLPPAPHTPSTRPSWFAREDTRAADRARRFHIGLGVSGWDRRRARVAEVERELAEEALRREAEGPIGQDEDSHARGRGGGILKNNASAEWDEEDEDGGQQKEKRERKKLRFTLCGLPYPLVVRQQRRRAEGEEARQAQWVRWLEREEAVAREERRVCALEDGGRDLTLE